MFQAILTTLCKFEKNGKHYETFSKGAGKDFERNRKNFEAFPKVRILKKIEKIISKKIRNFSKVLSVT